LRGDCVADCVLHAAEGDEKSIAGGAEFMAGVPGNGGAEDAAMLLQCLLIPVCAQLRQSGRRVLDVAERSVTVPVGFVVMGSVGIRRSVVGSVSGVVRSIQYGRRV
jgi:hypothetical protein